MEEHLLDNAARYADTQNSMGGKFGNYLMMINFIRLNDNGVASPLGIITNLALLDTRSQ